jgi:hypothetical protein
MNASDILESFCLKTGRIGTTPETAHMALFDFTPNSDDRKAFALYVENDSWWDRERYSVGAPSAAAIAAGLSKYDAWDAGGEFWELGCHDRALMEAALHWSQWGDWAALKEGDFPPEWLASCFVDGKFPEAHNENNEIRTRSGGGVSTE